MTGTATRPLRAVVIDDTADVRELLCLALTRGGFEIVAEAADGRAGTEAVREHRPDLVLLDLAMPVMDGIEALPGIRLLVPGATIVVLSGFGAQQMSARAVAVGADGYVQKGAPLPSILDYVRSACETGAARAGRAERPLSLVGRPRDDTRPAPGAATGAPTGSWAQTAVDDLTRASTWEAVSMAPFGVLELADEPMFRVVFANAVAERLLGSARAGGPLAMSAPDLASLVAYHRLETDAAFEVVLDGGRARARLRRTGWSVLVYLDPFDDDADVLRDALAASAQELRGPVAVLGGVVEALEGGIADDEQHRRLMEAIVRQTRRLEEMTADLLVGAQIDGGTLRVDMAETDLVTLARRVVAAHPDVEVVVDDERHVHADAARLAQVLAALLANAHEHGGTPCSVRVHPDGDHVAVSVQDRGPDVAAGLEQAMFEEFVRSPDSTTPGTGLGLHVARTLARAMGGDVSHAARDGGGATFTVRLRAVHTREPTG